MGASRCVRRERWRSADASPAVQGDAAHAHAIQRTAYTWAHGTPVAQCVVLGSTGTRGRTALLWPNARSECRLRSGIGPSGIGPSGIGPSVIGPVSADCSGSDAIAIAIAIAHTLASRARPCSAHQRSQRTPQRCATQLNSPALAQALAHCACAPSRAAARQLAPKRSDATSSVVS